MVAGMLLRPFSVITGTELSLPGNASFILTLIGIGFITGLAAGSYPAFYLSGFNTKTAIKGEIMHSWRALWLRKGLVVFQYSLCIIFIVGTLVTYKQISLIQTIDLGYK